MKFRNIFVKILLTICAAAIVICGTRENPFGAQASFLSVSAARADEGRGGDDGRSWRVVANAGFDRHASIGQAVQLDASKSLSGEGRALSYWWRVKQAPAGSKATLSNPTAVRPTFTLDVAGDYVFELTARSAASHDDDAVDRASVTISTVDVAPVADAGLNRRAAIGATIAFDGSHSFDADGDAISYSWTLVQKPRRSKASLSDKTSVRPTMQLDVAGTYVAELIVTDKTGKVSAPSRVAVSTRDGLAGRASAGPAQSAGIGATARVDADGSYLASGAPTNTGWALIATPPGSKATLGVANDSRRTVTADMAGDYVVQMVISGAAKGRDDDESDDRRWASQSNARMATTLISTDNVTPVASTGAEQRVAVGAVVTLDGSKTTDVNGDLLAYTWSLISVPPGSQVTLDNVHSVSPKFTADVAGTYVAQLIAADAFGDSKPATVVVSTTLSGPIANAGPDVLGKPGASVLLDGSASLEPNCDPLMAQWTILGLGDQLTGSLSAPNSLSTNFNIPVAGVPLTQAVLTGPAVLPLGDDGDDDHWRAPLRLFSEGRLTSAGTTYAVWRIRNGAESAVSAALDSPGASFSQPLSVPAHSDLYIAVAANAGGSSYRLLVGGEVIAQAGVATTTFSDGRLVGGPPLQLSIAQLAVANGLLMDVDDVVVSTVEARPVAVLSATTPAYRGVLVQLDGRRSQNPNSDGSNAGLSYKWSLLSVPPGSKAALDAATSSVASFVPDAYGTYIAQLIISDGRLDSRPQTVVVTVAPRPPLAAAIAKSPTTIGQLETLDGSGSTDPDGNPITYAWTLTGVPTGSKATLSNASAVASTFTPDVVGTYTAKLVVSDAYGVSAPATVSILAEGGFAFTSPTGPQSVALGSRLTFTVAAKDPSGNPISYSLLGALPTGASFDTATGVFTFRPVSNTPNAYTFSFQATNGKKTVVLDVPVAITGTPNGTTAGLTTQVYDAADYANGVLTPVSGATVSAGSVSGTSNSSGAVSIAGLPAGQDALLVSAANASPAPDGSKYLDTVVSANLIAGVVNTLDKPILLARSSGGGQINGAGATTITNPSLGVTLTIAQNSAFNADGTPYTGQISIGSLPANTPVNLPPGFSPCQLLVISPVGVTFNPPAQLTLANNDKLPAGALVDLWAFDPQLANSRVVGIGKVSANATTITTFIGGVPGGTILAMTPRRPGLAEQKTQPTDVFSPSVLGGGDLAASFSPPGVRQLNAGRALTFVYHSSAANPRAAIDAKALLGPGLGLPQTIQTRLSVAGVTQSMALTTNLSTPLAGGAALDPTRQNSVLQAGIADATNLPSGSYQYSFLTISKYACSAVGSQTSGSFVVNNQAQSAFGAGWQLAEVQKLNKQADGSLAIAEGNGRVLIAHAEQAPDFLPDPVYVPVNGPFLGATPDLLGDGLPSILRLGWKDGTLNVILNKGNRQFAKTSTTVIGDAGTQNSDGTLNLDVNDVTAGDVTGDGVIDVAYLNSKHNEAKILFGATGGTFVPVPLVVESNGAGGAIVMGDFIGDGYGHLMMSENQGGYPDFHIIYNDGKSKFTFFRDAPRLPGYAVTHVKVRLPGFQHDTVAGLTANNALVFTYGGNTSGNWGSAWSRGPSNTGFWQLVIDEQVIDQILLPTPLAPVGPSRVLATADIDGTGAPSFAVATPQAIHIVKWLAPGANNQQIVQTLKLPNGLAPDSVTLAPLAKGNRPSLIVTAKTAGVYVFQNDGTGNFATTPQFIATPFRVGIDADVVDFDGDGIADIALNDLDNDRVAIFFGKPHPDGAFVAPIGDYTRLVRNANGSYSRVYNDGTVVTFDASGFQTTIVDANGNTTNYSYNGSGQLAAIVDPTGATTTFTYAGPWLASTTDGAGRTTSFQHDASGNLTQVTDPLGNVTQYLYDANHQLIATIDPNGGKTSNTFNSTGQLTKQTYPDGASVTLDVSRALGLDALGVNLGGPSNAAFVPASSRITQMQDGNGNSMESEVNEWGAVTRVTDALGRVSRFYRDATNRVLHSETPAGVSTGPATPSSTGFAQIGSSDLLVNDYTWDANGNLVVLHEANGHAAYFGTYSVVDRTTTWTYEPTHNKVVQKTDPDGYVTKWSYDVNGNMVAKTDALGGVLSYTYNAQGLPLSKKDANGNVTNYAYDTSGNLTRTTDAAGTFFDRYYDAAGNLILSIDATGTSVERRHSAKFDANNRVILATSATGETTSTNYDGNGNAVRLVDAAGNVTTKTYDGLNRLLSVTTPDAGSHSFTYDNNNNRLTDKDASGATTSYVYDAANRITAATDGLGATRTLGYDLGDNAITVTDARGGVSTFAYDVLKRLNTRSSPDKDGAFLYTWDRRDNLISGSTAAWNQSQWVKYDGLSRIVTDGYYRNFTYDANGNVLRIDGENRISLAYAYDALNRRVSETTTGYASPFQLNIAYDALSRRSSVTDNYNAKTSYAYDGEDRLLSLTTPWGGVIAQSYDAAGRPSRMAYPNGLDADLSFEASTGRLASVNHRAGSLATPLAQFSHSYDIRGDLATLIELTGTKSFNYDAIERLTGVTRTAPGPATQVESYTYDTEGNRVASHISPSYVTDAANRVLDDGMNAYAWSPNGALLSRTPKADPAAKLTFQSSWHSYLNQMRLDAISGAFAMHFYYDPLGRNAFRMFDYDPTIGTMQRYHDGPDMVLERRQARSQSQQWVRYVHGQGMDQPLALEIYPVGAPPTPGTGSQYYYHADGEGSIRLLTTAQGLVANQYSYDSYGQRQTVVESVAQPFGWKAREFIPGPNLYFNRARFYDPVLGRFLSEDPLGYGGGDWNLYSFAWNNPKNWNDPSGLSAAAEEAGLSSMTPVAAAAGVGCALSVTFSEVAAWLSGDATHEVVGFKAGPTLCTVSPVLRAKPIPWANPPGTKTGDHDPGGDCWRRNMEVKAWKAASAAVGKCKNGMNEIERGIRAFVWRQLATARAKRDQMCWSGGDEGHQQAQADAWTNAGNCQ